MRGRSKRNSSARGASNGSGNRAKRVGPRRAALSKLTTRSQSAYDRALHVIAAMRRDPNLRLSAATRLHGVKAETIRKYFPSELRKSGGSFRVRKSDRYSANIYLPDRNGNHVLVSTRSSKERKQASQYLRDLGRYLRGQKNALAKWHGKKIAGVELVTAGRTIAAIEPALSEFSLYRAANGGAA
jgi:hypothetical protein